MIILGLNAYFLAIEYFKNDNFKSLHHNLFS